MTVPVDLAAGALGLYSAVGDVFGATWCDCHNAIQGSLQAIVEAGCGALIYLHQNSKSFAVEQLGDQRELPDQADQGFLRQVLVPEVRVEFA